MTELARPSLVANLHDECDIAIANVNDPQALRLLARVLDEKSKAAKAKAKEIEAGDG
jgi:hypothetical protein